MITMRAAGSPIINHCVRVTLEQHLRQSHHNCAGLCNSLSLSIATYHIRQCEHHPRGEPSHNTMQAALTRPRVSTGWHAVNSRTLCMLAPLPYLLHRHVPRLCHVVHRLAARRSPRCAQAAALCAHYALYQLTDEGIAAAAALSTSPHALTPVQRPPHTLVPCPPYAAGRPAFSSGAGCVSRRGALRRSVIADAASLQFIRGVEEPSVPEVKLMRAR